jgi:hypothetical protein
VVAKSTSKPITPIKGTITFDQLRLIKIHENNHGKGSAGIKV